MHGESYEEWLERTRPATPAPTADPRRWDVAVCVLLGVFFLWVGGATAVVGLALVAVLVVEQVVIARSPQTTPAARHLRVRGAVLGVTLLLSGWLIWLQGVPAVPLPVLLVLLDVKDDRSVLRWVRERVGAGGRA